MKLIIAERIKIIYNAKVNFKSKLQCKSGSDGKKQANKQTKNLPEMQETWVKFLDGEDSLEKGMATHSNILAWRIPWVRGAWWATVQEVVKSRT